MNQEEEFNETLKFYGRRQKLKQSLNEFHDSMEIETSTELNRDVKKTIPMWKKYWPVTAIAACVAIACIAGTLLITLSLESKQDAYYVELRRNVEQIKKSQTQILADMAQSKGKQNAFPGKYAGTGFLISANGYVATSYHVIKEADSVYVENEKYGRLKTKIVYSDPQNDVSILRIEGDAFKPIRSLPFTIFQNEASLGEEAFTLGFPREDIVFGEGSISASTGYRQNPNAYQISVPVNPGNSGGPLLNSKGNVIGVVSGIQTETSGAAFAIKSGILLEAIKLVPTDSLRKPPVPPAVNNLANLGRVQQIAKWREFVFMVRVYK